MRKLSTTDGRALIESAMVVGYSTPLLSAGENIGPHIIIGYSKYLPSVPQINAAGEQRIYWNARMNRKKFFLKAFTTT